ncbi:cytoplasmic protein, partial [Bacillus cereus]
IQAPNRMVAASKEQSFFQSFKSLFSRAKQEKTNE